MQVIADILMLGRNTPPRAKRTENVKNEERERDIYIEKWVSRIVDLPD